MYIDKGFSKNFYRIEYSMWHTLLSGSITEVLISDIVDVIVLIQMQLVPRQTIFTCIDTCKLSLKEIDVLYAPRHACYVILCAPCMPVCGHRSADCLPGFAFFKSCNILIKITAVYCSKMPGWRARQCNVCYQWKCVLWQWDTLVFQIVSIFCCVIGISDVNNE